jgi:hypothetical protein
MSPAVQSLAALVLVGLALRILLDAFLFIGTSALLLAHGNDRRSANDGSHL